MNGKKAGAPSEAFLEAVIDAQCRRIPLAPGVVCHIGRGARNTIVLDDDQVSRSHAMVQSTPSGEFYLTDLGSRNGTLVNQRRVSVPLILHPGDRITIGGHELLFHGLAGARPAEKRARGETVVAFSQRLITVLVADIRDFTGLSRRLGEDRLSKVISFFMRQSGEILAGLGAWEQKYIGDAIMAIWLHQKDTPSLQEARPVFAALEKEFELAAGLQSSFGLEEPIRIGAGINTGFACLGNMGSEASSDYTALSDAVNLCFRLEAATREIGCDLALGQKTFQFLAENVEVGQLFEMRTLQLKGYEGPAPVYAAGKASLSTLLEKLRQALNADSTTPALKRAHDAA
ncbi:MAG: adenylate/guanylate cyclase domain-containing protein [Acidobacteria bacterium]|nr:adenylate/guanylate cyclase domain-containing protein [Acidobacteriota bacterium]